MTALGAPVGALLAPAFGYAVVIRSDLARSVMVTSAVAVGCTREGSGCAQTVRVVFPDRPDVVYPASVRAITKIGPRTAAAILTVDRGNLTALDLSDRVLQGDALSELPCGSPAINTYVASVGEDGAWIRAGTRMTRDGAGCPLLDDAGNLVAIVDGSEDPLYPDPAFLSLNAALSSNSRFQLQSRWQTAALAPALSNARALSPAGQMPQPGTRDDRWFNAMPWWCRAADLGNVEAKVMCARGYATGNGAPVDVAYALQLAQAAEQQGATGAATIRTDFGQSEETIRRRRDALQSGDRNDPLVQAEIGEAYQSGVGARQDASDAVSWFARCQGHVSLCDYELGRAYLDGRGAIADEKRGVQLLERAGSHCDNPPKLAQEYDFYGSKCYQAFIQLGIYYNNEYNPAYSPAKARAYYERAITGNAFATFAQDQVRRIDAAVSTAKANDASLPLEAQIAQANQHFANYPGELFYASNAAAFRKLAASRDPDALYAAGVFFSKSAFDKSGSVDDDETAFEYFSEAGKGGSYLAAHELSIAYLLGRGTNKNEAASRQFGLLSVELARKAALKQDPGAYEFLGSSYFYGSANYTPVVPDCHEAIKWYLLAAAGKDQIAYYNLGVLYTGQGEFGVYDEDVSCRDLAAGERWLRTAISLGNTNAMVLLAVLLRNGGLGRTDLAEALQLLQKAADNGNYDAKGRLPK